MKAQANSGQSVIERFKHGDVYIAQRLAAERARCRRVDLLSAAKVRQPGSEQLYTVSVIETGL